MAKILIHEVSAARIAWKRYQKLPMSLVAQARDPLLRSMLVGASLVFCPVRHQLVGHSRPYSQVGYDAEPAPQRRSDARNFSTFPQPIEIEYAYSAIF